MPPKVEFEQIDEHGSMVHSVISCSLGFHGKGCCDPSTIGGYTLSFNRLYFFVLYSGQSPTASGMIYDHVSLRCQDRLTELPHDLSENRVLDPIVTGFWLCH